MEMLEVIIFISVLMWYIIDRIKPMWAEWSCGKYITMAVSAALAFTLVFGYDLDIVTALGVASPSIIGHGLTALLLMGGSSAVAELIGKFKK